MFFQTTNILWFLPFFFFKVVYNFPVTVFIILFSLHITNRLQKGRLGELLHLLD